MGDRKDNTSSNTPKDSGNDTNTKLPARPLVAAEKRPIESHTPTAIKKPESAPEAPVKAAKAAARPQSRSHQSVAHNDEVRIHVRHGEQPGEVANRAIAISNQMDSRRPAIIMASVITLVFVLALVWSGLSDRYAPWTARGVVTANTAVIAPRVSGRIISIEVAENEPVKRGQVLMRIDDRQYQINSETAKVRLKRASQGVEAAVSNLASARSRVAKARAEESNAKLRYIRSVKLLKRGVIAKARLDTDTASYKSAEAALKSAISDAESARNQLGDPGTNNVEIRAAELSLEQAEYDLVSTVVRAPSDGYVTNVHISVGQYLNAGSSAITFVDGEAAWIIAPLRENQLGNINPGDDARISFDAAPGEVFDGKVESIAYGINPGSQESGGLRVSIPPTQWFEPARRMPVSIVLNGGMKNWPHTARIGGKVGVLVLAKGKENPVGIISMFIQDLVSWTTIIY